MCLTVVDITGQGDATFEISRETLDRTNLSALKPGAHVNLERALRASDRLSGHIVQGHVDGCARLEKIMPLGECFELSLDLPPELSRYCVL